MCKDKYYIISQTRTATNIYKYVLIRVKYIYILGTMQKVSIMDDK
jgi:hypothetical protein